MNWATQIAAWLATTASAVIVRVVPAVVQPPHAKPVIIAMIAPQIRPQLPYFTFAVVSAFIDVPSWTIPAVKPFRLYAGAHRRRAAS